MNTRKALIETSNIKCGLSRRHTSTTGIKGIVTRHKVSVSVLELDFGQTLFPTVTGVDVPDRSFGVTDALGHRSASVACFRGGGPGDGLSEFIHHVGRPVLWAFKVEVLGETWCCVWSSVACV